MIGRHRSRIIFSNRIRWAAVVAATFAGLFGALQHWDQTTTTLPHGSARFTLLSSAQHWSKWAIPVLSGAVVCLGLLQKIAGPAEVWTVVHHVLNRLHARVFRQEGNKAEHRVTLLAAKSWFFTWPWRAWPPWGTWLVPVERSHHLTRKSKACFRVDDDGTAEGVGAQAYVQRAVILVENLPNICPSDLGPTPNLKWRFFRICCKRKCLSTPQLDQAKLYAEKTWCSLSRVISQKVKKKSMPRAMCALPVEVEGGKLWGVIVIDTRSEKLPEKTELERFYADNASVISELLGVLK